MKVVVGVKYIGRGESFSLQPIRKVIFDSEAATSFKESCLAACLKRGKTLSLDLPDENADIVWTIHEGMFSMGFY
jgi:hypothetical protein